MTIIGGAHATRPTAEMHRFGGMGKKPHYGVPFLEAIEADQEEDQKWEAAFAETTPEQWEKMAEGVRKQRRRGESIHFDDYLRSQ